MRRAFSLIVAAALLSVPGISSAQDKAGVTLTPYGFALFNTFWNAGPFANKDSPYSVSRDSATDSGGSFLMMARASRIGLRLSNLDAGFLGAELSGVMEIDFLGNYVPAVTTGTSCGGTATATTVCAQVQTTSWQAPLPRMRLASGTLTWKTHYGTWRLLLGQDYGLMGPVFAQTLAYVKDPIFVNAGKIYRRTPQARLTYAKEGSGWGLAVAGAALNPNDADVGTPNNTIRVDFGSGNRSRVPDLEARVTGSAKVSENFGGTVDVAYHSGWRRYYFDPLTGPSHIDRRATTFGLSLLATLSQYLEGRAEWYQSKGNDDGENGGFSPSVTGVGSPATLELLHTSGWWFQSIFKPLPQLWFAFGHGIAKADRANYGATTAFPRYQNEHTHGMLLVNAGKNLKFSGEVAAVTTSYIGSGGNGSVTAKATQYSANAQVLF